MSYHSQTAGCRQSKVWGETSCIFCDTNSETHYLKIKKGGFSSKHSHTYKFNRFFLISGALEVISYKKLENEELKEDSRLTLGAGQFIDISPGIIHMFNCLEEAECLEVYWVPPINPSDIIRTKENGGLNA